MFLLPFCPDAAEYIFARGIFRVLSAGIGFVSGLFPFSVTEVLLYAVLVALLICIVSMCLKRLRVVVFFRITGWVLSCFILLYVLMHGANFYRYRTDQLLVLDRAVSTDDLFYVCSQLAQEASALRIQTQEDQEGCFRLTEGVDDALLHTDEFYALLAEQYDFLSDPVKRAKGVWISPLWSYTGITGMYMPLLAEANINTDVPQSSIYITIAHELAHTKGFAREDECNFWAYLACSRSANIDARYSAYLFAYQYLSSELYALDRDLYNAVADEISEDVKRDIMQLSAYWKMHSGTIGQISQQVNDAFIRAQGEQAGIKSYDMVTYLIVAYEMQAGM